MSQQARPDGGPEMSNAPTMRASDRDRQEIVDLLRGAVGDGRLKLDEYMDRMELAYQAVTFADLAPLCADLPARGSRAARPPDPADVTPSLPSGSEASFAGKPQA